MIRRLSTFLRRCLTDIGEFIAPASATRAARRRWRENRRDFLRYVLREKAGPRGFPVVVPRERK